MVLAATPNQASLGRRRACSTSIIENESIALMQCPSVLSAPTLMGHFFAYNAILQPPHTMRRVDVVLVAPQFRHHQVADELVAPRPSLIT